MRDSKYIVGLVAGLGFSLLFALLVTRGPAPAHAQSNTIGARQADALEDIARSLKVMERACK